MSRRPKTVRCERCGRRHRGSNDWNVALKDGIVVGFLCPACQTPQENAEAVINEATLDYGLDSTHRVTGAPRTDGLGSAVTMTAHELATDLFLRTEGAVRQVAARVVETGVPLSLDDAVQIVEDGLPAAYPGPPLGAPDRRQVIAMMARDILTGEAYE